MNCLLFSKEQEIKAQTKDTNDLNDVWNSISLVQDPEQESDESTQASLEEETGASKKRPSNSTAIKKIMMKKLKKHGALKRK